MSARIREGRGGGGVGGGGGGGWCVVFFFNDTATTEIYTLSLHDALPISFTFITWSELEFKKTSGKEKLRCPSCDNDRSDKTDKSLIIYHNDGRGRCFYCDALT